MSDIIKEYVEEVKPKPIINGVTGKIESVNITPTHKSQRLMDEFFVNFADKIIKGIIYTPKYSFYKYGELEDLMNEGRIAIFNSITRCQWREWIPAKDKETKVLILNEDGSQKMIKGTNLFSFLSIVVSKNLLSYTLKINKDHKFKANQEIEKLIDNENLTYNQDFDRAFIANEFFDQLYNFFHDKENFLELTSLLQHFFYQEMRDKFIKKDFIEFAKSYSFSPSLTNTFFAHIKRIKGVKELLGQ